MFSCVGFIVLSLVELAVIGYVDKIVAEWKVKREEEIRLKTNQEMESSPLLQTDGHTTEYGSLNGLLVTDNHIECRDRCCSFALTEVTVGESSIGQKIRLIKTPTRNFRRFFLRCFASTYGRLRLKIFNTETWNVEFVDKFSQRFFPSMFTLFNVVYWWYSMSESKAE